MSLNAFAKQVVTSMGKANPDIVLDPNKSVEFIPTGCLSFDLVAGGGLPRGRLTEVFGMEHSGKTALALATHREVQKIGGTSLHIDAEYAFDETHARQTYRLVQNDTFKVFQPACAEEAGALLDLIIASGIKIDFISIDSVDALKPKDLIEGALDKEARVGAQAKKVGQIVTKCRLYAMRTNTAILFLNQMRVNINTSKFEQNVGTGAGYNPMESHTVPGGYALRFYASLRMKLEYGGKIEIEAGENAISGEAEKQRTGQKVKIINIKNKVGTPFLKTLANFEYPAIAKGQRGGWSRGLDIIDILKKRGLIQQRATKFIYHGLDIPEWSNIGSKVASERKFCDTPEVMVDATKLIYSLVVDDKRKAEEALDRGEAAPTLSVMESLNLDERSLIEEVEIQTTEQYKNEAEEILPADLSIPVQTNGSVSAISGEAKNNPFAEAKSSPFASPQANEITL